MFDCLVLYMEFHTEICEMSTWNFWVFLCFYYFFFEKVLDKRGRMVYDKDNKSGGDYHE